MAAGPIPRSSIVDHTRGWHPDDAEMFRVCIRRMDAVYRDHKPSKMPVNVDHVELSPQERLTKIFGNRIN